MADANSALEPCTPELLARCAKCLGPHTGESSSDTDAEKRDDRRRDTASSELDPFASLLDPLSPAALDMHDPILEFLDLLFTGAPQGGRNHVNAPAEHLTPLDRNLDACILPGP